MWGVSCERLAQPSDIELAWCGDCGVYHTIGFHPGHPDQGVHDPHGGKSGGAGLTPSRNPKPIMEPDIPVPAGKMASLSDSHISNASEGTTFQGRTPEEIRNFTDNAWGSGVEGYTTRVTNVETDLNGQTTFNMSIDNDEGFTQYYPKTFIIF